ncbi:unnamed protein product [Tuber aestivum]|uniref:Uncharacterized protein n=1 Tax=Tuber aestivum TaxID=59557 RepID=A0A292PKN9_9PEZI|nr:unnamed protein product [Tuber aestivum]
MFRVLSKQIFKPAGVRHHHHYPLRVSLPREIGTARAEQLRNTNINNTFNNSYSTTRENGPTSSTAGSQLPDLSGLDTRELFRHLVLSQTLLFREIDRLAGGPGEKNQVKDSRNWLGTKLRSTGAEMGGQSKDTCDSCSRVSRGGRDRKRDEGGEWDKTDIMLYIVYFFLGPLCLYQMFYPEWEEYCKRKQKLRQHDGCVKACLHGKTNNT